MRLDPMPRWEGPFAGLADAVATSDASVPMFRAAILALFRAMSSSRWRSNSVRPSESPASSPSSSSAGVAGAGGADTAEDLLPDLLFADAGVSAAAFFSSFTAATVTSATVTSLPRRERFLALAVALTSTAAQTAARSSLERARKPVMSEAVYSPSEASTMGRTASPMPAME